MSTSTVCKVDDVDFHIVGAVRLLESVSSCVPVSVRLCMCLPVSICLCLCVRVHLLGEECTLAPAADR